MCMSLCTQQMMCVGTALHTESSNNMTSDTSQKVGSKQAYVTKSTVHAHVHVYALLDVQNYTTQKAIRPHDGTHRYAIQPQLHPETSANFVS